MKHKRYMIRQISCFLTAAVMMGAVATCFSHATTSGQDSLGHIGVPVTWFDFGTDYTYYSIQDDMDTGFYALTLQNPASNKYQVGCVNGKGEIVLQPDAYNTSSFGMGNHNTFVLQKDTTLHCISADGIKTIGGKDYSEIDTLYNGYATVTLKSTSNKGVIDKNGVLIFEDKSRKYKSFTSLGQGLFSGEINDTTFHLLDSTGTSLTQTPYSTIYSASDDTLLVCKDEKWGYLDFSGKEIIPPIYDQASGFQGDVAAVCKDGKWGVVDKTGTEIIPLTLDSAPYFNNGLIDVSLNEKWGLMDKSGKLIVPIEYDDMLRYNPNSKLYATSKGKQTFFLNSTGELVKTLDYSSVYFYEGDQIAVEKEVNGSVISAFLDTDENMLTGYKEYGLGYLSDKLYLGIKQGSHPPGIVPPHDYSQRFALVDAHGNNLTGFKYSNTGDFFNNFQVVFKDYYHNAGLVNQYGVEVLPTIFENIILTEDGYAFITIGDPDSGENTRVGYFKIPDSFAEVKGIHPITVYLDGLELYFDSEPVIVNQNTMVPLRKIFESLGSTVNWDNKTRTVTAINGNKTIKLTIGSDTAYVNDSKVQLDAVPFIQNDSTFVPLRFISENLGANVEWDNASRRVMITRANESDKV